MTPKCFFFPYSFYFKGQAKGLKKKIMTASDLVQGNTVPSKQACFLPIPQK